MKKKYSGKAGIEQKKAGPDSGKQESGVKKKRKEKPAVKKAMK